MIKKVHISESERNNILNQYRLIVEETTFSVTGVVLNKDTQEPIVNARVILSKEGVNSMGANTDLDGNFTINNITQGEYKLSVTESSDNFSQFDETLTINKDITNIKVYLSPLKNIKEVNLIPKLATSLIFNFIDTEGNKINNVDFKIYKEKNSPISLLPELTTTNGKTHIYVDNKGELIEKGKKYDDKLLKGLGDFDTKEKGMCKVFKSAYVVAKTQKFVSKKTKIDFCLNNSTWLITSEIKDTKNKNPENKDSEDVEYVRLWDHPSESEDNTMWETTNIFNIEFLKPIISGTFKSIDDMDKPIPSVKINLYSDSTKSKLVKTLLTNNDGSVTETFTVNDFELFDGDDVVSKIILYAEINQTGYKPYFDRVKLKYDENNDINFILKSIKPPREPRPPKPMKFMACQKVIRKYYDSVDKIIKGKMKLDEMGDDISIIEQREQVEKCYLDFEEKYSFVTKKRIRRLRNVVPKYNILELTFSFDQQRDIYKENYNMSFRNTIRKVVTEQSQKKKSIITEKNIVKNRLFFILENSNMNNLKKNLIKESKELIETGYNKNLVKESFMDIMTSMKDKSQDFLMDVKNQLGQKIADTVKDKQQEHEMILGAFKELNPAVVEKAFKENKVDELSQIIADKALLNYKSQFGEGGIFGSMIASVDTNKFKQEVSKLLQTAMDQINTEMANNVKDAVSDKETE